MVITWKPGRKLFDSLAAKLRLSDLRLDFHPMAIRASAAARAAKAAKAAAAKAATPTTTLPPGQPKPRGRPRKKTAQPAGNGAAAEVSGQAFW